jgi:hypothetical protein
VPSRSSITLQAGGEASILLKTPSLVEDVDDRGKGQKFEIMKERSIGAIDSDM